MSKVTNLCGNPNCCPHIREDTKKGIMYVVEGKKEIPFNQEQVRNLTKYLIKRG